MMICIRPFGKVSGLNGHDTSKNTTQNAINWKHIFRSRTGLHRSKLTASKSLSRVCLHVSELICSHANTIADTEPVSVKAGKFKAWKVRRASNGRDQAGVITSENAWYAPEIGLPLKLVRSIGSNATMFQGP